ncbi:MAG: dihydroneopterin aldolase [Thermoplasmatota archaeon]
MDRITLAGMSFFVHVGHTAAERKVGHHLEVDIVMDTDTSRAGATDALADSIDYARAYRVLRETLEGKEMNLLEAVAERAADALKPLGASRVVVRVRKREPPIPHGRAAYAEVEIERRFR